MTSVLAEKGPDMDDGTGRYAVEVLLVDDDQGMSS
jgi:hypothetical protein